MGLGPPRAYSDQYRVAGAEDFMPDTAAEEREDRSSCSRDIAPYTVTEERMVYVVSKQRQVRCRLWFQVTPFRDGLRRFFLIGTEELE